MLSKEDNDIVTKCGPGTLMGNLMRQYWVPAMLSSELPEPDCNPVRVLLLNEKLIGFRDSNGKVGLVADACPHRGASLFFGRNEECGLRCVYHGWKFDVDGTCVDMPNEPAESNFKNKVTAVAYPCVERGGLVWTYMGPRETPPPLPELEPNMMPEGQHRTFAVQRECNWLQALEGDIDTCHTSWLHWGSVELDDVPADSYLYYNLKQKAPRYEVTDTEAGALYGAYRDAGPGHIYWRLAQFLFPFWTMTPTNVLGLQIIGRAWVPMDDEHMMFFHMSGFQKPVAAGAGNAPGAGQVRGGNAPMVLLPNTTDWLGRFRMASNITNDYGIDREAQRKNESYTGITGIHLQDQAVTESMGPVYDRTKEHLGTSDSMVIRVRRRLIQAAKALAELGTVPPGVDNPQAYRQRSGGVILPAGSDWVAATEKLREAFIDHPELDPAVSGGA